MNYQKNTWATGDEITAAKLNNLENGIQAAADELEELAGKAGGSGGAAEEVLPEQDFTEWTANSSGDVYTCTVTDAGDVTLIPGKVYAVLWNTQEYICECYDNLQAGGVVLSDVSMLGNGEIIGSNATVKNDAPFFLMVNNSTLVIRTTDSRNSHKVGIYTAQSVNVAQIQATADDEGKFLRVVNGTPAWVAVAQAETASF